MNDCPDKKEIGERLKLLRKNAGFRSAKGFAEFAGLSASAYVEYEQGRSTLSYENAWKIADALRVSLDELGDRAWPPAGSVADPRRTELMESFDLLNEDGRTLAAEAVASMARDPLRQADGPGKERLEPGDAKAETDRMSA